MKPILKIATTVFLISITGAIAAQEKYTPDWESLSKYKTPAWFQDAKFGIFIHWGVYSVPAYIGEWYPRAMYRRQSREHKYHLEKYGHPGEFGYKDFIPMFKAERWDPERWVKLFKASGARYVVPVAEHHDGFPMYDCSYTAYNAAKMGPKRDIIGELLEACRKSDLKTGVSSHRAFNWEFYAQEEEFDTYNTAYSDLYGKRRTQKWPDEAFAEDWYLRTKELAIKYKPDIFWFDFYLDQPELHDVRYQFAADYYNASLSWGKEVVLQYKYDIYDPRVGLLDIERGKLSGINKFPWQTDTSISFRGWGYIQNPEYKPAGLLIDDLIDIVSKNGNLLLNIGPKPDGTIPKEQQNVLLEIGKWLETNGESIYGTRPWITFGEGPTKTTAGAHQERKNRGGSSKDYRFTVKGNTLYATCLDWPDEDFSIVTLGKELTEKYGIKIKNISLLGYEGKLKWQQSPGHLKIERPDQKPGEHAYVFKVETKGLASQMLIHQKNLPEEPETVYCFPGNSLRVGDGYNVRDGKLNQWKKDVVLRWDLKIREAGNYEIKALQRNEMNEKYILSVNNKSFLNPDQKSGKEFLDVKLGEVRFDNPGSYELTMKASPDDEWHKKLSLKQVKLTKVTKQ